ncbi:MAG: hemerythrin domain-containing protein [Candidatus Omnitrophica bacterium]|nr:hemerythrin domain-containing protein [Candidatus Omnitrophota bacterium]
MEEKRIASFYGHDHDELDAHFHDYRNLKREDYKKAKESFMKFESDLQRHIIWEEDILFPLFEEKTGMHNSGPTFVMREEHRQIKDYLKQIYAKVEQNDPETDTEEESLLELLKSHNQKEESVLYPAIDQVTSEEDKETVFQKMKVDK